MGTISNERFSDKAITPVKSIESLSSAELSCSPSNKMDTLQYSHVPKKSITDRRSLKLEKLTIGGRESPELWEENSREGPIPLRRQGSNASSFVHRDEVLHNSSSLVARQDTNSIINSIDEKASSNEVDSYLHDSNGIEGIKIPSVFSKDGLPLLKISHKSKKRVYFQIDLQNFKFVIKIALNFSSSIQSTNLQKLLSPNSSHSFKSKFHEFTVDDIKAYFVGIEAHNYREELHISKEFENKWITVIYYDQKKGKMKTIHLVTDTEYDHTKVLTAIENLKRLRDELANSLLIDLKETDEVQRQFILGKALKESEKTVREYLSFNDILKYSKRLNINLKPSFLKDIFDSVCPEESSREKGLDFDQFRRFVSILKKRVDIEKIWQSLCGKDRYMTFSGFKKFMKNVQQENLTDEFLSKIFKKFALKDGDFWIPESFNNFLLSKHSSYLLDEFEEIDYFDKPLNEYYISSSHNTYLTGRQVIGASSIEGYIKALQRGCKCVEIDIWDGEEIGSEDAQVTSEPIVCHGRTLTSSISLSNVLKTIKKYAFITSPFPLIISLEINCSIENQYKVIKTLLEVLGSSLVTTPVDDKSDLPSPASLKHRILLKVKRTNPFNTVIVKESGSYFSSTTTSTTSFSEDNGLGGSITSKFSIRRKNRHKNVADELSNLGVYIQGLKFRNFSLPESKTYNHCFSLSEKSVNSMLKDDIKKKSLFKHNRKFFMRVYPSSIRYKSSNFNPIDYWSHGVQMVATNWQTYDLGQQLNEALFHRVNNKGYRLKPLEFRKAFFKQSLRNSSPELMTTKFSIKIISGHQFPKPNREFSSVINPFINVEVIGAQKISWDSTILSTRTKIVKENGFNPIWDESFSGYIYSFNDLVFIRLTIFSSSSVEIEEEKTPLAIMVSKLFDLRQGYRYLPLTDLLGEELIHSSIFAKISYQVI